MLPVRSVGLEHRTSSRLDAGCSGPAFSSFPFSMFQSRRGKRPVNPWIYEFEREVVVTSNQRLITQYQVPNESGRRGEWFLWPVARLVKWLEPTGTVILVNHT
jgi:hypothetical protein